VVAPSGRFTIGSPESEPGRDKGESEVEVGIARAFAVGKFAVTRGEFEAFVRATGRPVAEACDIWTGTEWKRVAGKSFRDPGFAQDDRHPAVCVTLDDAEQYAAWLSKTTGRTYRLLSEAEREYAARAGTTTPYWFGSSITPALANYDGNYVYGGGGAKGEYRERTVPVDSFAPNAWALYNVHGNVSEWTADCWNESNAGNPGDGSARAGDCSSRVVRGGSWVNDPADLRAAARDSDPVDSRLSFLGFRVGRTLGP
jgi:formylglycine-generating enzyme required for sulfatase activity